MFVLSFIPFVAKVKLIPAPISLFLLIVNVTSGSTLIILLTNFSSNSVAKVNVADAVKDFVTSKPTAKPVYKSKESRAFSSAPKFVTKSAATDKAFFPKETPKLKIFPPTLQKESSVLYVYPAVNSKDFSPEKEA